MFFYNDTHKLVTVDIRILALWTIHKQIGRCPNVQIYMAMITWDIYKEQFSL
jgi:hypothetical protein